MVKKKTLKEYHKIYPARVGDTVEKFHKFEKFCEKHPYPKLGDDYHSWYAKLTKYMNK